MDAVWQWLALWGPWIVLTVCGLVGLAGSVLPGVPGGGLIIAGIWVFAIWTGFEWISWPTLLITSVLAIVGGVGQYFVSSYGARKFGASKWGAGGAFIGFLIGMLVFPPLGGIIGAFLGATAVELYRNRSQIKEEMAAAREKRFAARQAACGTAPPRATRPKKNLLKAPPRKGAEPAEPAEPAEQRDTDDDANAELAEPAEPAEPAEQRDTDDDANAELCGLAGEIIDAARSPMETAETDVKKRSVARTATLAGVGAVLGSVASFLFEFLFACLTLAALIIGLLF